MATYRERREARAERLRTWADGNEAKGDAAYESARQIADLIPFGQPILVGHHSEGRHRRDLARIDRGMGRSVEASRKAESQRSRADNIEAAAEAAIYDDDPDAIDRLAAKLAALEARREEIKAHNRAMRKACDHAADCDCRSAYPRNCDCKRHPLPSYVLSNLGGNITRTRQRLERLRREAEAPKLATVRGSRHGYYAKCTDPECSFPYVRGLTAEQAREIAVTHNAEVHGHVVEQRRADHDGLPDPRGQVVKVREATEAPVTHERAGSMADFLGNTERSCTCGETFTGDAAASFELRDAHIEAETGARP